MAQEDGGEQGQGILTDNALVPSRQSFPARTAVGVEPRAADVRAENQTQFGDFPSVPVALDKSRLCRRAGKSSLWVGHFPPNSIPSCL